MSQPIGAIDLDGVLFNTLDNGNYPDDYLKKKAITGAVEALKMLKALGHYIKLFTARYEEDREVTVQSLSENGFDGLYDELIMGKPKFDYMVDDRALRFDNWEDTINRIYNLHRHGRWY